MLRSGHGTQRVHLTSLCLAETAFRSSARTAQSVSPHYGPKTGNDHLATRQRRQLSISKHGDDQIRRCARITTDKACQPSEFEECRVGVDFALSQPVE